MFRGAQRWPSSVHLGAPPPAPPHPWQPKPAATRLRPRPHRATTARRGRSAGVAVATQGTSPLRKLLSALAIPLRPLGWLRRRLVLLLFFYVGTCILVYGALEGWSPTDSVYFAVTSMMTVGFGDLRPTCMASKAFDCLWVLAVLVFLASRINEALTKWVNQELEQAERSLRQRFHASLLDEEETPAFDERQRSRQIRKRFVKQVLMLLAFVVFSTVVVRFALQLSLFDALYFSVVTLTTTGLGDIVPTTPQAKWVVSGLCLVGVPLFGSTIAGLVGLTMSRSPHVRRIRGGLTPAKLCCMQHFAQAMYERGLYPKDMDMNDALAGERKISAFEFCCFVLLQNKVINMEDMDLMLRNFKELDIEEDGYLWSQDVKAWDAQQKRKEGNAAGESEEAS